jgi:hypothetical protein
MFHRQTKNNYFVLRYLWVITAVVVVAFGASFAKAEVSETPSGFGKNFVFLNSLKSFVAEDLEERFENAPMSWGFRFKHNFYDKWLMGVGFEQVNLIKKRSKDSLYLKTVNHETLYIVRVYHPTYLAVGPTYRYFIPSQKNGFIIRRDSEYVVEIGVGLQAQLTHRFSNGMLVSASAERWRGTGTNRFHIWNLGASIGYALK